MVDPQYTDSLATICELAVVVLEALPLLEGLIKYKDLGLSFDQKSMLSPMYLTSTHDCDKQSHVLSH